MEYHDFTAEEGNFPLFYKFNLSAESLGKIQDFISRSGKSFTDSLVFNTGTKENEHNEKLRQSKRISLQDSQLFQLLNETVMSEVNRHAKQSGFLMQLVEDEIDIIKYEEGGFFKKHRDFVNFISDQMKCYVLIICLEGTQEGGETKLHFSDDNVVTINETRITGGCTVFRNEIFHEGCVVSKGNKVILKANIRCFEDYEGIVNLNDYLMVRFPNDSRFYVLHDVVYKRYPKSIFALHKFFGGSPAEKREITLQNVTYEQFQPIYDVMVNNATIDYLEHKDLVDYLGITNPTIAALGGVHDILMKKYQAKMNEFNDFLQSKKRLLLVKSYDDYSTYKELMSDMDNIIPIQFMITGDPNKKGRYLEALSIYDCIPVCVVDRWRVHYGGFHEDDYDEYDPDYEPDTESENEDEPDPDPDDTEDTDVEDQEDQGRTPVHSSTEDPNVEIHGAIRKKRGSPYIWLKTWKLKGYMDVGKLRLLMMQKYASPGVSNQDYYGKPKPQAYAPYTKILNILNEYDYLKTFMALSFDVIAATYEEIGYGHDDFNKMRVSELHSDMRISTEKMDNAIRSLKACNIEEILTNLGDKRSCFKDYTSGLYHCNEACYFSAFGNIYFGFVNTMA